MSCFSCRRKKLSSFLLLKGAESPFALCPSIEGRKPGTKPLFRKRKGELAWREDSWGKALSRAIERRNNRPRAPRSFERVKEKIEGLRLKTPKLRTKNKIVIIFALGVCKLLSSSLIPFLLGTSPSRSCAARERAPFSAKASKGEKKQESCFRSPTIVHHRSPQTPFLDGFFLSCPSARPSLSPKHAHRTVKGNSSSSPDSGIGEGGRRKKETTGT